MDQDPDAGPSRTPAEALQSQQTVPVGSEAPFASPDTHNDSPSSNLTIDPPQRDTTSSDQDALARDTDADPADFYKSHPLPSSTSAPSMAASSPNSGTQTIRHVGSSVKNPVLPESRTTPRTDLRSISGPVGGRAASTPSVKDLMKRFDQNDAAAGASRIPFPSGLPLHRKRDPATPTKNNAENGSLVSSKIRQSSSSPQVSSPQSFASRINNPKRHVSEHVTPIKRTNATHVPGQPRLSNESPPAPQGLLFGEILPEHKDASVAGYGIRPHTARSTSDTSIHGRPRNSSGTDIEASSSATLFQNSDDHREAVVMSTPPTQQHAHVRSRSDASAVESPRISASEAPNSTFKPSTSSTSISPSSSKLPVPVRRVYSPTGSESSRPSRPSTPPSQRRNQNGSISRDTSSNQVSNHGSTTPTSRTSTPVLATRDVRPKSASQSRSSHRHPPYPAVPPPSQAATPKVSRPRTSGSLATTAQSRSKDDARTRSLHSSGGRHQKRPSDSSGRRRKINVGPVDYEQRREHIRLAYSKSIRESQALEARRKAAARESETSPIDHDEPVPAIPQIYDDPPATAPALKVSTTMPSEQDSPTLGIPGQFPQASSTATQDDTPQSAVSTTSATTEFDNEPQTTPPVPAQPQSPFGVPTTVVNPPSPQLGQPAHLRAEYRSPFPTEDGEVQGQPLNPQGADAKDVLWTPPATATTQDDFEESFNRPPPAPASYQTTVTILRPEQLTASSSKPLTPPVPFPRMGAADESDYCSEVDNGADLSHQNQPEVEYATTETCTEDNEEHYLNEDHMYESRYGEDLSHRASTCASDIGTAHDHPFSESAASGLGIPSTSYRSNRASHQSSWTDYSVETTDQSDIPVGPDATITQSSHRLLEVDTGEGFTVPYLSPQTNRMSSHMPSPDHEPPPIPTSASGSAVNSRPSSAFYDQSQPSSTLLNSERESDGYASYNDTPHSVDTPSFETAEQELNQHPSADGDGKSSITDSEETVGKELRRLAQRRNVIKELVDTEAVFVRDMNIVEEIYKGTAEACPNLDDQTVKLIFRNSHEIIEFHTMFLAELKVAVAGVYVPKGGRTAKMKQAFTTVEAQGPGEELDDNRDRETAISSVFQRNVENMKTVHESFLRNSDQAAKRLIQIQQDSTVKVWLNECNEVAKDLTAAWDLDSLLIKPMQRITKYPNLIITMLQHTPQDHPDREGLTAAKDTLETAIIEINKTKKNFELVGQIVGRKRKESDVKTGLARAFGKRVDKLQTSGNRPSEDALYAKLKEKFGDDYLRLQVVLRDVEFYTRQVSEYVQEFLRYLSSIELVMRLQPGNYPELESKWVQFNISMRDLEKVVLEDHLAQVRKQVIEPFEQVIKAYGNPSLAMKKRQKRRADFERAEQHKRSGKSLDPKLREQLEQYDALNDALVKELPMLSTLTERVGNICLSNFVNIQANWYKIWKEKMKTVLAESSDMPELQDIVETFQRDHPFAAEQMANISMLNPSYKGRVSQSTVASVDDNNRLAQPRTASGERRGRGLSVNNEASSNATPDSTRNRDSLPASVTQSTSGNVVSSGQVPSPHQYHYRDYYSGIQTYAGSSSSPKSFDMAASAKSAAGTGHTSTRPSTGRSMDSAGMPRQSYESTTYQRDSNTTYSSSQLPQDRGRFSNLFHSALPLNDGPNESQRSSRASSRDRGQDGDGYNVLWLAASLFEFNIATTKHEAGYPYLIYQAGEVS